jgi:hypothetical protein
MVGHQDPRPDLHTSRAAGYRQGTAVKRVIGIIKRKPAPARCRYTYMCDVLQRMVDGHAINRLGELLPCAGRQRRPPYSE